MTVIELISCCFMIIFSFAGCIFWHLHFKQLNNETRYVSKAVRDYRAQNNIEAQPSRQ